MADQDFDIEWVGKDRTSGAASIPLPQNIVAVGSIENDDVKVYIRQDVYKNIEKLSKSDTTKELGSILIGDYCEEMGKTHVVISDYIEAKYTDATASTLTFTHETWDYIHAQMNSHYRDKKIIGWQHTHPNYGIFLSNYDLFIQENFFNLSFQVAYVVDPIADTRGFFQWKHGQIQKLNGFYVYDEIGKNIGIGNTKAAKSSGVEDAAIRRGGSYPFSFIVLSIMLACLVGLGYFTYRANDQYQALQVEQHMTSVKIAYYEQAAEVQGLVITDQRKMMVEMKGELEEAKEQLAVLLQSVSDIPERVEVQPVVAPIVDADPSVVRFVSYTVQEGDTLSQICIIHGIPYHKYLRIIRSTNGLDEADFIQAGQVLLLPVRVG